MKRTHTSIPLFEHRPMKWIKSVHCYGIMLPGNTTTDAQKNDDVRYVYTYVCCLWRLD